MPSSDAIIIGAGPNGLACAVALAQDGQGVTLIEAAAHTGGSAAVSHLLTGLDPRVARAMGLTPSVLGLRPLPTVALDADGNHLTLDGAATNSPDAAAWAALHSRLDRFARALAPFRAMTPPHLKGPGNETLKLARLGLGVRGMGKTEFRELLRMILINVADVLEDNLTDDRLMGAVAFDTTLGAWLGPRSPNSLILLLNRMAQDAPCWPAGGMGAVAAAMTRAAEAAGVAVLTGTPVAKVLVRDDRAFGVELADGTVHFAKHIVSAIHPRTTLETLVGPAHLDTGTLRRSRNIRSRGAAATLHLTLSGAPDLRGAEPLSRFVVAPSVRAVEEAWNAVKYGEVPARPVMEFLLPAALDATPGPQTLSAIVQFAPHDPADREAARARMLANTLTVLEDHLPGLRALVTDARLAMPYDIEAQTGMIGGNWHHGELAVERMLFLRPIVGAAHYASPLPGLWLGSAGTHPGGGVNGAAGWNAAQALIRAVRP